MTLDVQLVVIVCCLLFLLHIVYVIKRGRLQLRYSLLWFALAALLLFFAIFPEPLFNLAHAFGFVSSLNAIYFASILFLGVETFFLNSIISQQAEDIKDLTQKVALLEHKLEMGKIPGK